MAHVRGVTLIVIGLVIIGVLAFLASRMSDGPSSGGGQQIPAGSRTTSRIPANDVVPVWKDWPVPQTALLITGEQHGYFEPCGCTENQMGGMARRADLAGKLQQAGWELHGVDLGGLARRTVRQAQIKFETSLQALRQLNYAAIGIGPEELRLQPDFLISQDVPDADGNQLSFLSANLVFFETPDLGIPKPIHVLKAGGRRIGITSIMDEATKQTVLPEGAASDITWTEVAPALTKALAEFDSQQVDFRILLSHSTQETSEALAEQFPQFDVIVMAQSFSDPDPKAAPAVIGKTRMLQVGHKGKYVGVLGLYPGDDEQPVRFQLIPLERSEFEDSASMIAQMANYQQRLHDEQIVLTDGAIGHPSGASFVGVDRCRDCHQNSCEVWDASHHAHALDSLDPVHKRDGFERLNGISRMFDPECLSCHVTGWDPQEYIRYRSGFLNEEFAEGDEKSLQRLLAGNQCENCHGPASRHIELIESGDIDLAKQQVSITLEQGKTICYRCHDVDNSPNFDFDKHWPEVEHYEAE